MPLFASTTVFRLVDSIAIAMSQAYQLARLRLASAASPVLRLMVDRDQALDEIALLRRELEILRTHREQIPSHRRPDYPPEQRLAILQLRRLRGWGIQRTAERFVIHPNTVRLWIKAVEGHGNSRLLARVIVWNRLDDAVRWTVHELRRLCPEKEFGSRTLARHILRAGIQISRSTAQRILRETEPKNPLRRAQPAMAKPTGVQPYHLLRPKYPNRVWHIDLLTLRLLWFRWTVVGILDGFSRKLLALHVYSHTPRARDITSLVRHKIKAYGKPRFIITDHGTQFRRTFHQSLMRLKIKHVRGRVRAPYLNGKMERAFKTFRIYWRLVLAGLTRQNIQRRLDDYQQWYNHFRPHSSLQGITPDQAWQGDESLPVPIPIRARDHLPLQVDVIRRKCRGDPRLPVIEITLRSAA